MKRTFGEHLFDWMNVIVLSLIILVSVYPILYVFNSSVSDPNELLRSQSLMLLPKGFQWDAYGRVFHNPKIYTGYMNTLFYVVAGTFFNLLMTSFAAYALSRPDLFGRKFFMKLITFTMFFGGGMIPTFLLVQSLDLVNTRWAMIIPAAINTFYFIIMRTSFENIPVSLIESANWMGLMIFRFYLKLYYRFPRRSLP